MSRREVDVGASTLKSLGAVDGAIDKEGERLACKSQTVYTKVATHTHTSFHTIFIGYKWNKGALWSHTNCGISGYSKLIVCEGA